MRPSALDRVAYCSPRDLALGALRGLDVLAHAFRGQLESVSNLFIGQVRRVFQLGTKNGIKQVFHDHLTMGNRVVFRLCGFDVVSKV